MAWLMHLLCVYVNLKICIERLGARVMGPLSSNGACFMYIIPSLSLAKHEHFEELMYI